MKELNIEALAEDLAWEWVYEGVMGDSWYGYPSGEAQEREAMIAHLPEAREEAKRYARLLGVLD